MIFVNTVATYFKTIAMIRSTRIWLQAAYPLHSPTMQASWASQRPVATWRTPKETAALPTKTTNQNWARNKGKRIGRPLWRPNNANWSKSTQKSNRWPLITTAEKISLSLHLKNSLKSSYRVWRRSRPFIRSWLVGFTSRLASRWSLTSRIRRQH